MHLCVCSHVTSLIVAIHVEIIMCWLLQGEGEGKRLRGSEGEEEQGIEGRDRGSMHLDRGRECMSEGVKERRERRFLFVL